MFDWVDTIWQILLINIASLPIKTLFADHHSDDNYLLKLMISKFATLNNRHMSNSSVSLANMMRQSCILLVQANHYFRDQAHQARRKWTLKQKKTNWASPSPFLAQSEQHPALHTLVTRKSTRDGSKSGKSIGRRQERSLRLEGSILEGVDPKGQLWQLC